MPMQRFLHSKEFEIFKKYLPAVKNSFHGKKPNAYYLQHSFFLTKIDLNIFQKKFPIVLMAVINNYNSDNDFLNFSW